MGQIDLYDLISPNDEVGKLRREVSELRNTLENVRKGLFARHNTFLKMYTECVEEVTALKEAVHELKSSQRWRAEEALVREA